MQGLATIEHNATYYGVEDPVCDTCEECVAEFWWGKQLWCSDCLDDHIASLPAEDDN